MLVEELAQNCRHVIASLVVNFVIISYMGIRSLIIDIFSNILSSLNDPKVKSKVNPGEDLMSDLYRVSECELK